MIFMTITATFFILITLFLWLQQNKLTALKLKLMYELDKAHEQIKLKDHETKKTKDKLEQTKDDYRHLHDQQDQSKRKIGQFLEEIETHKKNVQLKNSEIRELQSQFEKKISQLEELMDVKNKEIEIEKSKSIPKPASKALTDELKTLREKYRDLSDKNKKLEQDHNDLVQRTKDLTPELLMKMKRRIAQYDRLYQSMRGLKELAEERNQNWEFALAKLSDWVLLQNKKTTPQDSGLGKKVGLALETIGTTLVVDEHTQGQQSEHA